MPTERSVLLLGPPGVGKSTVGRLTAAKLNIRFMDLDDFVRPVYDPIALKRPMTDSEVNEALKNLFDACRPGDLIEFSHHDYDFALSDYEQRFNHKPRIALLIAEPGVCYQRNSLRDSPVPLKYVARCIQSSQQLAAEMSDDLGIVSCVLKNDHNEVELSVNHLVRFIDKGP